MPNTIPDTIYQVPVVDSEGKSSDLSAWRHKVLLIVNVASRCGFTRQYHDLQALQKKYASRGFSVLAFPCNQFMRQESGSMQQIKAFCAVKFNISFPVFNKINVNGPRSAPIYQYLKQHVGQRPWLDTIPWNFTKFLVDANGRVLRRYLPYHDLKKIDRDIERLVAKA